MPKVSVILTSYNHGEYLNEAIQSVLCQSFQDFELIIWDDASTDDSWHIINKYSDDRIRAFRNDETRRGIYGLNKAIIEVASGEYIAIHHSDDIWAQTKLEKQVEFLLFHPEIGAVFTNVLAIDESGTPLSDTTHYYASIFAQSNRTRWEWLNFFFYRRNALCHPSVLIRKQCYIDCGTYRLGFAQLCDFDMWVRLCLKYDIYILPEKLTRFRVRNDEANMSGNKVEAHIRCETEMFQILKLYLQINHSEDFLAIFPEARQWLLLEGEQENNIKFAFAMLCLQKGNLHLIKAFGINLIFDLYQDSPHKEPPEITSMYDYRDLIKLTGAFDMFSQIENGELRKQLTECNKALQVKLEPEVNNSQFIDFAAESKTMQKDKLIAQNAVQRDKIIGWYKKLVKLFQSGRRNFWEK